MDKNMNFKEFLSSFEADDFLMEESPALFERITIARKLVNENLSIQRSVKAPQYLTDFGLRPSEDPYLFMKYYCKKLGKKLPDESKVLNELKN